MKKEILKKLEDLKMKLEKCLDDYSLDFVNCYPVDSYGYITDAVSEFADNNTSIYYNDQRNFYYNNVELCDETLLDYGYSLDDMLKEGNTLDDLICKAGAIGAYRHIEETINNELEDVIKLIIINYILNNKINCDIDFLDNIDIYNLNRFDDLRDLIEENIQEEEEEEKNEGF